MIDLKEKLTESLEEAEWQWLEPHALRGALILVAPAVDLVEVAVAVARDDVTAIQRWLEQGLLSKPTQAQLGHWKTLPEQRFLSLIVQPYVLALQMPVEVS